MNFIWRRVLVVYVMCCVFGRIRAKPSTQPTRQNNQMGLLDSMAGVTLGEERARSVQYPYPYGNLIPIESLESAYHIRSFDNIGGSNLIKKKSFDNIGGSNLIRSFDNIGGSNLIKKKSFDNIDDLVPRHHNDRFVGNVLRRKDPSRFPNPGTQFRTMDSLSGITFGQQKRSDSSFSDMISDDEKRFGYFGSPINKREVINQQRHLQSQRSSDDESSENY